MPYYVPYAAHRTMAPGAYRTVPYRMNRTIPYCLKVILNGFVPLP